jgi:hypothetical protein
VRNHHQEQHLMKCPRCHNGYQDDGGACYHCGTTGEISDELYFTDQVTNLCLEIAIQLVHDRRKLSNQNPDGEGWAFHAAECGCSEQVYTQGQILAEQDRIMDVFSRFDRPLMRAIVKLFEGKNNEKAAS